MFLHGEIIVCPLSLFFPQPVVSSIFMLSGFLQCLIAHHKNIFLSNTSLILFSICV